MNCIKAKNVLIILLAASGYATAAEPFITVGADLTRFYIGTGDASYKWAEAVSAGYRFGRDNQFAASLAYKPLKWTEVHSFSMGEPFSSGYMFESKRSDFRIDSFLVQGEWRSPLSKSPLAIGMGAELGYCRFESSVDLEGGGGFSGPYSDHESHGGSWRPYVGVFARIRWQITTYVSGHCSYGAGYSRYPGRRLGPGGGDASVSRLSFGLDIHFK